MHRTHVLAAVATTLLVLLGMPADAPAQQIEDGTITVIQPKPVLRRRRVQLTPRLSSTVNDALIRQWSIGGSLTYSPTERFFIGGIFESFDVGDSIGGTTLTYEEVIDGTRAVPEIAPLRWVAGVDFGYVPLYGKLVLFNKAIGYFDMYVSGGPMAVDSQSDIHVGGHIGAGVNLYFNRWLGLNTEFRDRLTMEELADGDDRFTNTVTGSIGLTIMLPFSFNYRYDDEGSR